MKWQCIVVHVVLFFTLMLSSEQVALGSTEQYVAEVYFVVDSKAFQIYVEEVNTDGNKIAIAKEKMEADIDFFLTQVNARYDTLLNLNLKISKRKVSILTNEDVFASSIIQSNTYVSTKDALNSFDSWLETEGSLSTLNYDLALLWTGYDLFSTGTETAGFAYVGTVCNGVQATSVVEYDGTYSTVINTAHEIAHNLGASHDSGSTGYIMAPSSSPSSNNRWSFSLCSSSDITGVITQITENCLTSSNADSTIPNSGITESLNNPNVLCARKKGASSYLCQNRNFYDNAAPKGDNVCKSFYCYLSGNTCGTVMSTDGMVCGSGKTCKEGTCQDDPASTTSDLNDNCLYGDQRRVTFGGSSQTCSQFLDSTYDHYCQSSETVRQLCCGTCTERYSGKPDCPYGDKSMSCALYSANEICGHAPNAAICCKTCQGYSGRKRRSANLMTPVILSADAPPVQDGANKKSQEDQENEKKILSHVPQAMA